MIIQPHRTVITNSHFQQPLDQRYRNIRQVLIPVTIKGNFSFFVKNNIVIVFKEFFCCNQICLIFFVKVEKYNLFIFLLYSFSK